MRTLVISDLHIGARTGRDVVRHPEVLEHLVAAVQTADRLVLLGDTIEMLEGRPQQSLAAAEPVLAALAEALGAGRPLLLVPGNHDHALIEPWVDAQLADGASIEPCSRVPLHSSPCLSTWLRWCAPQPWRCTTRRSIWVMACGRTTATTLTATSSARRCPPWATPSPAMSGRSASPSRGSPQRLPDRCRRRSGS